MPFWFTYISIAIPTEVLLYQWWHEQLSGGYLHIYISVFKELARIVTSCGRLQRSIKLLLKVLISTGSAQNIRFNSGIALLCIIPWMRDQIHIIFSYPVSCVTFFSLTSDSQGRYESRWPAMNNYRQMSHLLICCPIVKSSGRFQSTLSEVSSSDVKQVFNNFQEPSK